MDPVGSGEGLADETVRGTTIARAFCGPALIVAMTEAAASASIPARASLARFLLLFCGCCSSFALFDELLDLLAALLANLLVKARAVAVARWLERSAAFRRARDVDAEIKVEANQG